jgi:hypothetical protein
VRVRLSHRFPILSGHRGRSTLVYSLTIVKAERQKDGRWKVSFTTEDGGAGSITGALKVDTFAGDWDFRPNAVWTFTLTKAK